jgi:hypothetical protein
MPIKGHLRKLYPSKWGVRQSGIFVLLVSSVALNVYTKSAMPSSSSSMQRGRSVSVDAVLSVNPGASRVDFDELHDGSRCTLFVLISPQCYFCRRMRVAWQRHYQEWAKAVGGTPRAVWIGIGDAASIQEFYSQYPLAPATLTRVEEGASKVMRELGILGTPTSILLDNQSRVAYVLMGEGFPPPDDTSRACSA